MQLKDASKILIFVRHAPKAFTNGMKVFHSEFNVASSPKLYPLDPPLASDSITKKYVSEIIRNIKENCPTNRTWDIVSSPFMRTSETANDILGQLLLNDELVTGNVKFNLQLFEYLGFQNRHNFSNCQLFNTSTNSKILKEILFHRWPTHVTQIYDWFFDEKVGNIPIRTDAFVMDWLNGHHGNSTIVVSHNIIHHNLTKSVIGLCKNIHIQHFRVGDDDMTIYMNLD